MFYASGGSFNLVGNPMNESISFTQFTYTVTFKESNLLKGTKWSVIFNGKEQNSTSSVILFAATNGTYSYSILSVNGYTVSTPTGTTKVNGSNVVVTIPFSANKISQNNPSYLEYVIIVSIIAISAFVIIMVNYRRRR
ncbi:hypothetical protein B1A_15961 [mine drainage metagenome]|uniref:Thermopsin n=1 Tax=mine drainage metagenome TaxID=410659 RepID=T1AMZ2_9ZZZZ